VTRFLQHHEVRFVGHGHLIILYIISYMLKRCPRCTKDKSFEDDFYTDDRYRDGKSNRCKECTKEAATISHKAHPERVRANSKRWRERMGPKLLADYSRRRRFGLPLGTYDLLLAEQGHVCAICQETPPEDEPLGVDHCHTTGRIRGLLCNTCNSGIGYFRDDPKLVDQAARYLRRDKEIQTLHPPRPRERKRRAASV
jgi:Recombination endonuclease VII